MIERYRVITEILDLIDKEREFCRRFYELNPDANDDRKHDMKIAIAAYSQILYKIAE